MQTARQHIEKMRNDLGPPPRIVSLALSRRQAVRKPDWVDEDDESSALFRDSEQLLRHGEIRWAYIVQGDTRLFEKGKVDLPATILYCADTSFDCRIDGLEEIAEHLFDLKGDDFDDPELNLFATALATATMPLYHQSLPRKTSREPGLRCTSIIVHRKMLPNRKLSHAWFPIFVAPDVTPATHVVSYKYWPRLLVKLWKATSD